MRTIAAPGQGLVLAVAALFPALVLLRGYEAWLLWSSGIPLQTHAGPASTLALVGGALVADLLTAAGVSVVLGMLYLLLRPLGRGPARWVVLVGGLLAVLASVALIQYHAVARVPLGADFWGYNWTEIRATAATSGAIGWATILPYVLFGGGFLLCAAGLARRRLGAATVAAFCVAVVLLAGLLLLLPARVESGFRPNKLRLFGAASAGFVWEQWTGSRRAQVFVPAKEYPLLRPANAPDVLGPYLGRAPQPPNIVVVAVEGLGAAFMPGKRYGGLTPVLAGLIENSLYWPNAIAGSGRSFGFAPTFYGSLPYASSGFMELGPDMPAHDSLISLLNENGYFTGYFVGFDPHFDNADVFMERQGLDLLIGAARFGDSYEKLEPDQQGFSWGYADAALFARAAEALAQVPSAAPRLDMYHTLNLHEPFIVPNAARWRAEFEARLAALKANEQIKQVMRQHAALFTALVYTDAALGEMLAHYRARPDFSRTLFIITGDHHSIPIPHSNPLDRYNVPLIVYSPMLEAPQRFAAVTTHADVAPSLVAFLEHNYGLKFPERAHWLGEGLDTHGAFRAQRSLALMRTKNQLSDYLHNQYFLHEEDLYRIHENLVLEPIREPAITQQLAERLARFKALNRYVITHDKLKPAAPLELGEAARVAAENALFQELELYGKTPEELFAIAREAAFAGDRKRARLIASKVLREAPNYHDMRVLMARTHGWDGNYDRAREAITEVLRRDPGYIDAYSALADVERWDANPKAALEAAERGLARAPDSDALRLAKAEALLRLGRREQAVPLLRELEDAGGNIARRARELLAQAELAS